MVSTEATLDVTPVEPPSTPRRRLRSWMVIVVLVLAVGALLSQGLLQNLNYFETVDEAFSQRAQLGTKDFRLEGVVRTGSIERTSVGANFYLDGSKKNSVYVRESGSPPQLFQGNIPVVVDGHFTSATSRVFVANQIIVKHSSSYVAQHPNRVKAPNGSVR